MRSGKNKNKFLDYVYNYALKDLFANSSIKPKKYLNDLKKMHERVLNSNRKSDIKILKNFYYDKYIIKEENIPLRYFEQQERLYLDYGFGHYVLTSSFKKELIKRIINNQKKSLDVILDYFFNDNYQFNSPELKFWAFQGLIGLGKYDKEKQEFNRRSISTINPFCELNREALALTIDDMNKFINEEKLENSEILKLVNTIIFKKIYTYRLKYLKNTRHSKINNNDGIWKKYNMGSAPDILVKSLEGKETGWCTAAFESAKSQLEHGEFYIYYTKGLDNQYTEPRIAIRMNGTVEIGEIRGIGINQNVEDEMNNILETKLSQFANCDIYKKRILDMNKLTSIYNKFLNKEKLLKDDLIFLYEINNRIDGFGYKVDPRIKEILLTRNVKKDLSLLFNCSISDIGVYPDEFNGKLVYCGNIIPSQININNIKFPKFLKGNLYLDDLKNPIGLELPEYISGNLSLDGITNSKGLKLPGYIGGDLFLNGLGRIKDVIFSKNIGGSLYLENVNSINNVVFPEVIDGNLDLQSLSKVQNISFPKLIRGDFYLNNLININKTIFPKFVGGDLILSSLNIIKKSKLPQRIGKSLDLSNLANANNLILPEIIGEDLYLNNLTNIVKTQLPKIIDGNLDLSQLQYWDNLELPKMIGKDLYLDKVEKIDGITFSELIRGDLSLTSLINVDELLLPKTIDGQLFLSKQSFHNFQSRK